MKLFYKELTNRGETTTLTFSVQKIENISSRHFIKLKRPRLNEDRIATTVRNGYTKQISEGLFSKELSQKMEKEIENAIKKEEERILSLSHPTIFVGDICELKYQGEGMQIKASISLATAIYFIENSENIKEMEFELGDYPNYLSGEVLAWKVLDYKDDFLRENPHSMEIEDCFSEHISMIESQNKAHWSDPKWEGKAYVRPNIERSLDVIRDEAKTVVE